MNYPNTPEFAAVKFKGLYSNIKSETRSGRVQVRNVGGHKWSFSAKYALLTRKEIAPVMAFASSMEGMLKPFEIVLPEFSYAASGATGSLAAGATLSAGTDTCSVSGFAGNLLAGDMIKFAGHSKVYMLSSVGGSSISFTPALMANVNSGEAIMYNAVPFRVRMSNDVQTFEVKGNERWSYDVDMIEDIWYA